MMLQGEGVERGLLHMCVCGWKSRVCASRTRTAFVSGRGAAGCFPVLQPVIRAIFSLQATEGLEA